MLKKHEIIDRLIKTGVVVVGVGGKLATGTSESITETAKQFVAKVKEAREEK